MEDSGSSDGGSIPPGATKVTVFHQAVPYLKQLGKPALLRRAGGDSARSHFLVAKHTLDIKIYQTSTFT